jgi:hypothetical protein
MGWPEYFLQFLPPVFAIYLILVSGLAGRLVANRIKNFVESKSDEEIKKKVQLIQNLVLSGATQLSFLNSMFAAIVSATVYPLGRNSYRIAILAPLVILLILIPLMLWTLSLNPDELSATRFAGLRIRYALGCKIVLVIVNLILCVAIWLSNRP